MRVKFPNSCVREVTEIYWEPAWVDDDYNGESTGIFIDGNLVGALTEDYFVSVSEMVKCADDIVNQALINGFVDLTKYIEIMDFPKSEVWSFVMNTEILSYYYSDYKKVVRRQKLESHIF